MGCPDITLTVDPALRLPGFGRLLHVDLAADGGRRLGGSCLAQAFQQVVAVYSRSNRCWNRAHTKHETIRTCKMHPRGVQSPSSVSKLWAIAR